MKLKINQTAIYSLIVTFLLISSFNTLYATADHHIVVTISEIQGDGFSTPYYGDDVETTGIVTGDFQAYGLKGGFFLQDPVGDGDPSTSEGIFVFNFWTPVELGDEIKIEAEATEYYGLTELTSVDSIEILSTGNPLPDPVILNPPKNNDDANDYYEALEGMLVLGKKLRVTSATNRFGEFGAVNKHLGIKRVFEDDPDGTGEIIFADDAGGLLLNLKTGDEVYGLEGPLDYTFGAYKVLPSEANPPKIKEKRLRPDVVRSNSRHSQLSIASYNLFNLFDDIRDPGKLNEEYASSLWTAEEVTLKIDKHAQAIHHNLGEPDLIAFQEVEKIELLERLAGTAPIESNYGVVLVDGPDVRGIDVGLMYKTDKVSIISAAAMQGCTTIDDGLGPGTDPNHGCADGENPLFSRPPLQVHLEILGDRHHKTSDLWLIINHFKSKSQDGSVQVTLPRRVAQAVHVGNLVHEIQAEDEHAKVMVLGDLNDFEYRDPLLALEEAGLRNLIFDVRKKDRYTFVFNGVSEMLDHMLITPSLERVRPRTKIIHFNVDFPFLQHSEDPTTGVASSDHEALYTVLRLDHCGFHHGFFHRLYHFLHK
jgi:predicted extracellular nuclease